MKHFLYIATLVLFFSCHTSNEIAVYQFQNELLDTLVVRADKIPAGTSFLGGTYRSTPSRNFDLLHTSLYLDFNWTKRTVEGKADLVLTPYFYSTDKLVLDAVNFNIHAITTTRNSITDKLNYEYDGKKLLIQLDRKYSRHDTLEVSIAYRAHPEKDAHRQPYAIGSDQGMFFIDPDGKNPLKPTQIWTQGETEYNSRWFPTIDKPNERCTQELHVTVDNRFVTLSNGLLVDQQFLENNRRTDTWKLDMPHAPYLFALIVGEYATQKERWNGKEVGYYVYRDYHDSASKIFDHTPEMLTFFSDLTGIEYPWPKYSQVIVSDFISGAMENTTSVVFDEAFQKSREDLVDFPNDMIVAHEMSHHWFGNLVTCESWSNITLNEGFANYAEYLWQEYKYGRASADFYLRSELNYYLMSANKRTHPLIDFTYDHKDGMFDAHSYNKGALILHMLRGFLGDEAFFKGIRHYLKKHSFQAVEAHDLRIAFEEVCGLDLNWFFNQWFFDRGHPVISASYNYIDSLDVINIDIEQIQDTSKHRAVFQFPFEIEVVYADGTKLNDIIWINDKSINHQIRSDKEPVVILFNPYKEILCELNTEYTVYQTALIAKHADHVVTKYDALTDLKYKNGFDSYFKDALDHDFWAIRLIGLQNLNKNIEGSCIHQIEEIARNDVKPLLRMRAIRFLNQYHSDISELITEILEKDSSAMVISYGLDHLYRSDHPEMEKYARQFTNSRSQSIENSVASILGQSKNPEYFEFFESRLFSGNVFRRSNFISSYSRLLKHQPPAVIFKKCQWISDAISGIDDSVYEKNIYKTILIEQLEELRMIVSDAKLSEDELKELRSYINEISKMIS